VTDEMRPDQTPAAPAGASNRALALLGHFGTDAAVAAVWVALIVAIVLFSGVVSQFAYVDF
jgi:hypothetical protein